MVFVTMCSLSKCTQNVNGFEVIFCFVVLLSMLLELGVLSADHECIDLNVF